MSASLSSLEKPVVTFKFTTPNKCFKMSEDTSCLESMSYGMHHLVGQLQVFGRPLSCVSSWSGLEYLELFDAEVQSFFNQFQSPVIEFVDFLEPHEHRNPELVFEDDRHRIFDHCEVW